MLWLQTQLVSRLDQLWRTCCSFSDRMYCVWVKPQDCSGCWQRTEGHQSSKGYSIHPIVHDWCRELVCHDQAQWVKLAFLVIGFAIPSISEAKYWRLQQRLVPHADRCIAQERDVSRLDDDDHDLMNYASHMLDVLYADKGKHAKAKYMYRRALNGKKKAWELDHFFIVYTITNLRLLDADKSSIQKGRRYMHGCLI